MIPQDAYDQWCGAVPWTSPHEVEQDLVLTRLIAEVAQDEVLGQALAFKGGTCLHKVWMPAPWRYSEDLDYTIRGGVTLDEVKAAIKKIGADVGFSGLAASMGQGQQRVFHARLLGAFGDGTAMAVKLDIQLDAGEPASAFTTRCFSVDSAWFQASVDVLSHTPAEMLASKVAALYGRRRHRDLFDIWASLESNLATEQEIANCFSRYRPERWTALLAATNLKAKLGDIEYVNQLKQDVAYLQKPCDLPDIALTAARLIDACTAATQPQRRWRRVLSAKATATDVLGTWSHTQGLTDVPDDAATPMLRPRIVQLLKDRPKFSYAQIAQSLKASPSYVAQIAHQEGLTRGTKRGSNPKGRRA